MVVQGRECRVSGRARPVWRPFFVSVSGHGPAEGVGRVAHL